MTRKDYVLLAAALLNARPDTLAYSTAAQFDLAYTAWLACVYGIAAKLHADNPHFDAPRFHGACGVL